MKTEEIRKLNPIVWCKNEAELKEAGKLYERYTSITGYHKASPTKFCNNIYGIFGRIQRTDEPSYLIIVDGELKIGFDNPELFYRKKRILSLDEFKELV